MINFDDVLKQVEFLEVFLPYAWDGKQTYFEAMKANQYKALPPCA